MRAALAALVAPVMTVVSLAVTLVIASTIDLHSPLFTQSSTWASVLWFFAYIVWTQHTVLRILTAPERIPHSTPIPEPISYDEVRNAQGSTVGYDVPRCVLGSVVSREE